MATFQRHGAGGIASCGLARKGGLRTSFFAFSSAATTVTASRRAVGSIHLAHRRLESPPISIARPNHDDLRPKRPGEDTASDQYITGTELLHQGLVDYGVDKVFGVPLGLASADAFSDIYGSGDITSIVPRQEQSAGHMAEGYARASGKVGVVMATAPYAVTSLVTPMQDALSDGTPMVVLISQSDVSPSTSRDEFQRADTLGIATACTKWSSRVTSVEDLGLKLSQSFHIATSGRPGPVLLDIPPSTLRCSISSTKPKLILDTPSIPPISASAFLSPNQDTDEVLARVAKLIHKAKKPLLFVGQGMLATPEGPSILQEFVDKTNIPVTTSLQGLGAFDEADPRSLHMLGLHGTGYANMAVQTADLILALGARFDDRVTGHIPSFAPQALAASREGRGGIVHFDITLKNVNKVVEATEAVLGDCAANLERLTRRHFSSSPPPPPPPSSSSSSSPRDNDQRAAAVPPGREEWYSQIVSWKRRFPLSAYANSGTSTMSSSGVVIKPQHAIETLSRVAAASPLADQVLVSTGVGQHQMWAALHYQWRRPRSLLTSGGLGTMGYGLPAAIGAAASGRVVVVDIDGDASFNMSLPELATAARYGLPVKVLLLDNGEMGMVSDIQRFYYGGRFSQNRHVNPDFVLVSRAMGCAAERVAHRDELEDKIKWLLFESGERTPAVLDVVVERDTPVWPIVPAGRGLHEFVTYPEVAE